MSTPGAPDPLRSPLLIGRDRELQSLLALLDPAGPLVAHLHGVPGIGKSALMRAVVVAARSRSAAAHGLDCRAIEPTEAALRQALDELEPSASGPTIVCLDNYESFLLLDAWIRRELVPARAASMRLLLTSRSPPNPAWLSADFAFLGLRLRELADAQAGRLLADTNLSAREAAVILRFAKGHPLALRLACTAARSHVGEELEDLALHEVVRQLAAYFFADVPNGDARQALEAASAVRRVTVPLLGTMLNHDDPQTLYEALAVMPIVESRRDGLVLHPAVHEALAQHLRSADPARFTSYRRAAWRALEAQARDVAPGDLWRFTADAIYLIDNPVVRGAFFPEGAPRLAVEPATATDGEAILALVEQHDGDVERAVMAGWWQAMSQAFAVVRDVDRELLGFYCMLDPAMAPAEVLAADPMTAAWHADLPDELRSGPRRTLFLRRWLSREHGEAPSPVQAACWLDVKRSYLAMRPELRRVYLAVRDLVPYGSAAQQLGFVVVCAEAGLPLCTAMLDFGAGSVDAWLRRLVRQELGLQDELALDDGTRTLRIGGDRVELTQLEAAVMRVLFDECGATVSRNRLLAVAWGDRREAVGSNVVDVVIRALRKKMDRHSGAIVTVRGAGYRLQQ